MRSHVGNARLGIIPIAIGFLYFWINFEYAESELTPPYFNLATGRKIYASATCGVGIDEPELYCKLVGTNTENENYNVLQVIKGQFCDYCIPSQPDKHHPPENAIDGKETWWQSPPLSRGVKYNEVNLTIDFGQEFHVAYVFIRMGNSPRPGVWSLDKSTDYGKTWTSWQYFADNNADCKTYFGVGSDRQILRDNDTICTTEFSKIVPLENGEIPVRLIHGRPSSNNYFNSTTLQEWTRATNVRIRLLRTKTLLGHLMSVARQDPTVTRRYFYSIRDISVGGRCMCNGHADTCDVLDAKSSTRILACQCRHHTCGIQCNECCPGYVQKKWRQNTNAHPFQCEACNCFGHSNHCTYDEETDLKGLSLDIHGNYEGGGVCKDCQHHTMGINCNRCKPTYYRPYGKYWNETDVCRPCNCNNFNLTGNCEEETGRCECRKEFQEPDCKSCAYGYFGFPKCRECECNLNGTEGYYCQAEDGYCPCKPNFSGQFCKQCAPGYYKYPDCKACNCNGKGSVSNECDFVTGQCKCLSSFGGEKCERCEHGYYSYPTCKFCDCDIRGSQEEICDKELGVCLCKEGYGGPRCDQCLPGFYNYPDCIPCNCSTLGSAYTTCDYSGKCHCLPNFSGKQCTMCSVGYYSYPECLPCNCYGKGSEGISCNNEGQCTCHRNFDGKVCDACKEGFYNFPACEECNCDPAGVIARFAGCGSVPLGELCQCKERVTGRICNQCKPLYWNLNISNPDGCESCECLLDGTIGTLDTCDSKSGQCACKPTVQGRQCKECKDGTFDLFGGSLFGCKDCSCDVGGSRSSVCDKLTGQCKCHQRITGRRCIQPLTTHYFPTLYQFQYEYEDGYTPSGAHVRYQYDDFAFPEFSGKGYAVFQDVQDEVINEVAIIKSSVYRLVIRYVNPTEMNITADILITSDNPIEVDQKTKVLFKPSVKPQFVTVSGAKGIKPYPIVLDPGRYTISIKTENRVLLDYFVLLPAAYYEASILIKKIENPCELGNLHLCRHYRYPSVQEFKPFTDPFIAEEENVLDISSKKAIKPVEVYSDVEHLTLINSPTNIPLITDTQRNLNYLVDVPYTGKYIIVLDYVTNRELPETAFVKVKILDEDDDYGVVTLYPCLYTMSCRQPVVDDDSREKVFRIDLQDLRPIQVYHELEDFGSIAIISLTAIPYDQWSVDYVKPNPVCVMKDGQCVQSSLNPTRDSKKIEFEHDNGDRITLKSPPDVDEDGLKLIYLDQRDPNITIRSNTTDPGRYVIILKYYQPNHPQFNIPFVLETSKVNYVGKFEAQHCSSVTGCRSIIRPEGNVWWFDIDDKFNLTLVNNNTKGIWLDYVLTTRVELYRDDILQEQDFDRTKEFIEECGQNHFYIPLNASDFCRKAVFSLTAEYNQGALPCGCDYEGSTSFECDPFGGQCQCKPNVIGRKCDSCRTGYYGFPECKVCDCPSTAICEKETGKCICPKHVTGEECDRCEPYTYAYHQIVGCEECNCNNLGVLNGNLQCGIDDGHCQCRPNIEGRACDTCSDGYYNFPHCLKCRCHHPGTTSKICDKSDETCLCKKNVQGRHCDMCVEGTYNLQVANPEGCTTCFCFGKTTHCDSAYLRQFNVSLVANTSINNIIIEEDLKSAYVEPWKLQPEDYLNETTLRTDFSFAPTDNDLVYFGVFAYFLNQNNHLTAYGGNLVYTLYTTTGISDSAVRGPDVILSGKYTTLFYYNSEQPAQAQKFKAVVPIVESSFQTVDKKPVTRADLMMVLRDLEAIYIKANYFNQTVMSQLSDPYLTMAAEDEENYQLYQLLPVERCHCPQGYAGNSCEDCASGYYRIPDGPYGGYCVPCQCNGHSDECDCNTGICKNCDHFTIGDHCEMCIEGYYGNATYGTPYDCVICACPKPYDTNNFATSCEVSESRHEIHCTCKPGYTGARCESCSAGFYGNPEVIGDYCKPCECSGNINPNDANACDTRTGECTNCLNNTYGAACNLCAPGFYGDAITLKDCKACDCEELGIIECNSYTGFCKCLKNVVGLRCDRCEENHYGFSSGVGCEPCECGMASLSAQCDDYNGECSCKPGVTGRQCEKCANDHWNYTENGCTPCSCNRGYSRGIGCNSVTGQCECLPGVIGEKCDACPYRWVLVPDEGCHECTRCQHDLLDVTDDLQAKFNPVFDGLKSLHLTYYTRTRLDYYDKLSDDIRPKVEALDPKGIDLHPVLQDVESLELDAKNLAKRFSYARQNAQDSCTKVDKLLEDASEMLNQSRLVAENARRTIKEVDELFDNFDSGTGGESGKNESALMDAEKLLDRIESVTIDSSIAADQHHRSYELLKDIERFVQPVDRQKNALKDLKNDIEAFKSKLDDLTKFSKVALNDSQEADRLNKRNLNTYENSKFNTVELLTKEVEKNIDDIRNLIINGELTLEAIDKEVEKLKEVKDNLDAYNAKVNDKVLNSEGLSGDLLDLVNSASEHSSDLNSRAEKLKSLLSATTSDQNDVIKAVQAYSSVVDAVAAAQNATTNAQEYGAMATEKADGLQERATRSKKDANDLLRNARKTLNEIELELGPRLNQSAQKVNNISNLNEKSEVVVKEINDALQNQPSFSHRDIWENADKSATKAQARLEDILENIKPIVKKAPGHLGRALNISKDADDTNKEIIQAKNQVTRLKELVPRLLNLFDTLDEKQDAIGDKESIIEANVDSLMQKVRMARETANSIKVGVEFTPNTVLELKPPESLPFLTVSSQVSTFFNTTKPDGFLFYLGNDNKTGTVVGRGKSNDFMALEVENGYPVLTIDLGNGPERIINPKYVADGVWYQAVVERTGNRAKLIIREELDGFRIKEHRKESELPGLNSVFDVDKNSRLFVGGYPPDFTAPEGITYSSFEGQIEGLKIGEDDVGLWNFIDADNAKGAKVRDKLLTKAETGYRFNGNGYVVMDAKQYSFKLRSSIHFKFKASRESRDGLMFYAGSKRHFISVELRDGGVVFQYKLGEHTIGFRTATASPLNDDQWHTVEADRDGRQGLLKVDGKTMYQIEEPPPGTEENLLISGQMYFGGFPGSTNHTEITRNNFDGCIDDVVIGGVNVDLSKNLKSFNVRPGCPEKFSGTLSYAPGNLGYLKASNVSSDNDFVINLKFRTRQSHGVIFYATNHDQSSTIGLTIDDGQLELISMKEHLTAAPETYNDGSWHAVTITHDESALRMYVDDVMEFTSTLAPQAFYIQYGEIYFGGLPRNYYPARDALSTTAYFSGCIMDVTLNGRPINFANSIDRMGGNTADCPSNIFDYDFSSILLHYPGDEHYPAWEEPQTTTYSPPFTRTRVTQPPPEKEVIFVNRTRPVVEMTTTTTTTVPPPTVTERIDTFTKRPVVQTPKTTKKPPKRPTKPPRPEERECVLPWEPDYDVDYDSGYRFIGARDRRIDITTLPAKIRKTYDITLDFKAENSSGILFYADNRHSDYIAFYIHEGRIYHDFKNNQTMASIVTDSRYDNGQWHRAEFSRHPNKITLVVDNFEKLEYNLEENNRALVPSSPLYLGGVDSKFEEEIYSNLKLQKGTYFKGCIKDLQMSNKPVETVKLLGIPPCTDRLESGVFFGKEGGFVKLRDRFHVGAELAISFEFKPRTQTGLLFSVHGKQAYMVIQLHNGSLIFSVKSDERNMIEARFTPDVGVNFCDGKWRTVQAIKSQYVITLTVDSVSAEPAIGLTTKLSTDTTRPLFMGGHQYMNKQPAGLKTKEYFHGCIRNLKIRDKVEPISQEQARGDVWVGKCPEV